MATRGSRRHFVTLENPGTPVPDGDGGYTESWVALSPRKAEIKPATARDLERTIAGTVTASATHLITLDYDPEITTETRLTFESRVFAITGMSDPEERHLELILVCEESLS